MILVGSWLVLLPTTSLLIGLVNLVGIYLKTYQRNPVPIYVYACEADHRKEVTHSVKVNPEITCGECGLVMHRVPQAFTFYNDPIHSFDKMMDDGYANMMERRKRRSLS